MQRGETGDYTARLRHPAEFGRGDLLQRLLQLIKEQIGADLKPFDFRLTSPPPHLFMNFLVTGEHGRRLGMGSNLQQLQAELGAQARGCRRSTKSMMPLSKQGGAEQGICARWRERRDAMDNPLPEFLRWQLEEPRVSLFAQALRTPHPASIKRLDRACSETVV